MPSKGGLTPRAADLGYAPRFQAFSWLGVFSVSTASPRSHPKRVTRAVETVEKVSFQKLFLKSGTETLKSAWFFVY
jgi:hypothetical protein